MEDLSMKQRNPYSSKWNLMFNMNPNSEMTPLTVADMEFDVADPIKAALETFINTYPLVYSEVTHSYHEAVIDWFKNRHNITFDKDHMVQSTGVVSALYGLVEVLSQKGEGVLIQTPVYSQFMQVIKNTKRTIIDSPLVYDKGIYTIDFDDLDKKLEHAKIMILCQPHNPVGRIFSREELEKIHALTTKHQVTVISDEVHADFTITKPFISYFEVDPNAIICTGASKSFNLAALQTSNIFIPKQYTRDKFNERNNKLGVRNPNILGYIATEAAYRDGAVWLDDKISIIRSNYEYIEKSIQDTKLIISPLEGMYLAWINYENYGLKEETFMKLLRDNDLYVSPGSSFGQTGFFRINLAAPFEVIETFTTVLLNVVEKL